MIFKDMFGLLITKNDLTYSGAFLIYSNQFIYLPKSGLAIPFDVLEIKEIKLQEKLDE